MTLLFDIGNSRIKWQESAHFCESPNAFSYNPEELVAQLDRYLKLCDVPDQDVVIVSVVSEEINKQIESWITDRWHVRVHFLHSESKWQTLSNGYASATTLGADRWYTLIGAVSQYSSPLLVCDIGSAVTIDVVEQNGKHLGGYITPGIEMMIRSLSSDTNIDIKSSLLGREVGSIPNNTYSAIAEGCLWSIASQIDSLNERLDLKSTVVLTGGDAEMISPMLNGDVIIDKNLIFYGIKRVIEAP